MRTPDRVAPAASAMRATHRDTASTRVLDHGEATVTAKSGSPERIGEGISCMDSPVPRNPELVARVLESGRT